MAFGLKVGATVDLRKTLYSCLSRVVARTLDT